MDRKRFFATVRGDLFGGSLSQEQVEHVSAILDASAAAGWDISYTAYGLATAHHETARFVHLRELGGAGYFTRMYDIRGERPALARANGNIYPGDGAKFFGRGYVHLTWRSNYRRAGEKIGVDLERFPDAAATPANAARIMIEGMQAGWFTGKAMRHYLGSTPPDYRNARRIINGMDRADLIAGYAQAFERALRAAGYAPGVPPVTPRPTLPVQRPPKPAPAIPPSADIPKPAPAGEIRKGFWARFWKALARRMAK